MSAEKIIRAQARQKLKDGGWAKALIGLAMLAVFFMIVDCVMMLSSTVLTIFATTQTLEYIMSVACGTLTTVAFLLLSPALLGYVRMFISEQREYKLSEVVYYFTNFQRYTRALRLVISFILRIAVPIVICFMPVIIFVAIDKFSFDGLMQQNIYAATMCVLVLLSSFCLLIYSTRYFLVLILFYDELNSISFCFSQSKMIINRHSNDVVKLVLSFTWWILLCLLVMPIIYVIPYMIQSLCISGKWLLNLRNGQENELF